MTCVRGPRTSDSAHRLLAGTKSVVRISEPNWSLYAHLYGVTRDELRYILDPANIYGADFPSETFRVLKEKEIRLYGEYRTARLVLLPGTG